MYTIRELKEDGLRRVDIRYGDGLIMYDLTPQEAFQMIKAEAASMFLGGAPADYMTENLENLLCGNDPRHTVLRPLSDEQIAELSDEDISAMKKSYQIAIQTNRPTFLGKEF